MKKPEVHDTEKAASLKRFLHTRVTERTWATGAAYVLNLRTARCKGRGPITLKDPGAAGWPRRGRTAANEDEARAWVDVYVDRYGVAWFEGRREPRTVAEIADDYLSALQESAPRNTHINRRACVKNHILPAFGDSIPESLGAEMIQEWLSGLRKEDGQPYARTTLETILATLGEIWRSEYGKRRAPWAGAVSLALENGAVRRRRMAEAGERPDTVGAYSKDQLRRILEVAQRLDEEVFRDPKKNRAVPHVAYVIAFLFYLGLRVEELTFIRRQDVFLKERIILVPGTKSEGSWRYVPIQEAFEPWLADVLERTPLDPMAHLFSNADLNGAPSVDTLKDRVTEVLEVARLKVAKKGTHIFRASHITIGLASGRVRADEMDRFMGHSDGSIRGRHYMDAKVFARSLRRPNFRYLPHVAEPVGREMLVEDRLRRERWRDAR